MGDVEDYFDATGPTAAGFLTVFDPFNEPPPCSYGGVMYGSMIGLLGFSGNGGPNQQNGYALRAGVMGASDNFTGVAGASLNQPGVYGQIEDSPMVPGGLRAGVLGVASTQAGVIGFSRDGDGAQAASFTGTAFRAVSFFGPGVDSISGDRSGVTGMSGTQGPPLPNMATTAGVVGTSGDRPGVIGTSNASIGVIGFSNNVGVFGATSNLNSFAGAFDGNVVVTKTLTANVKNAVIAFPDGSQRVLHCMESPEHWFEDFGTAKLKKGRATVKLDGDFAKAIKPADYLVFVTPEGDCRGLYVRGKSTSSFDVRELGGGTSNVAFAYRIVGRRRDIKRHRRFEKVDMRLPSAEAMPRGSRRGQPTPAALRAFLASLEREAKARTPKGERRRSKSRPAGKPWKSGAAAAKR